MRKPMRMLAGEIEQCEACPRLREHCRRVAEVKRRAYRDFDYWGKPVPGFGDEKARVLVVGLAPGAHGANRTGRMFTGDRSGDFLFRALHETGFANQAESRERGDGLALRDVWITGAGRCAPPDNKPLPEELANCRRFLLEELRILRNIQVVVCLGRIALEAWARTGGLGRLEFGHGRWIAGEPKVVCSYHPSQQNTQTGRLTREMLAEVFAGVRRALE